MTLCLVRHALTAANGLRLVGRLPGVHLSPTGWTQARGLAAVLAPLAPNAIYTSPLERAVETAAPLSARLHQPVMLDDELVEIDFGAWTNRTFKELEPDPAWRQFNQNPATAVIPGGEPLASVAQRGASAIARIAGRHHAGVVVIISHGDVVRLALARLLQMPIDAFRLLAIAPGGCCRLVVGGAKIALDLDAAGLTSREPFDKSDRSDDARGSDYRPSIDRVS